VLEVSLGSVVAARSANARASQEDAPLGIVAAKRRDRIDESVDTRQRVVPATFRVVVVNLARLEPEENQPVARSGRELDRACMGLPPRGRVAVAERDHGQVRQRAQRLR